MTLRVFRPGQEEEARAEMRKQDTRVQFDGRTVLVESVFRTIVDVGILTNRIHEAAKGPRLRMVIGTLRQRPDLALVSKVFVNTDEPMEDVGKRIAAISPQPERVEVGVVSARDAAALWAQVHRAQDGGD